MSNWNIYVETDGSFPELPTSVIPRPHENTNVGMISTQQTIPLADGSLGYYTPENKFLRQELVFKWFMQYDTFREEVEGYIENHDYIKITNHLGESYLGRFLNVSSVWLVGESPDEYEITATFLRMDEEDG